MSLSKKLKRKKDRSTKKSASKLKASILKAELAAKRLKAINANRIKLYSKCRVMPTLVYVMYVEFGWRFKQLAEVQEKFLKFIEDYFPAGKHYCDVPGLQIGLEDECRLIYKSPLRETEPKDNTSTESWLQMYAGNLSCDAFEYLETIWLWVLHVDFGFGEKRISKCYEAIRKIQPLSMPIKMLKHMISILEQCKNGRRTAAIEFNDIKKQLKELDIDNSDFADGLLMVKAVR